MVPDKVAPAVMVVLYLGALFASNWPTGLILTGVFVLYIGIAYVLHRNREGTRGQ